MDHCAILSSDGNYTSFSYGDRKIRFRTSSQLEKYTDVKEWDHGYLVVTAKYKGQLPEEEYIDLIPILENLYVDPEQFLEPIHEVKISYV